MNPEQVLEALNEARRELARLGERIAALEAAVAGKPSADCIPAPPSSAVSPAPVNAQGLSEELVLVLSAAIAAFLGKKAHIHQIRLIGSTTWAQQGRVNIQASHTLSVHHSRSQP